MKRRDAEPAAFDGGSLEGQARYGLEAVEPGGEQRLQGSWDVDLRIVRAQPAAVDEETLIREHRRELLQIQRIPLGRLADAVDDGRRGVRAEQQLADSRESSGESGGRVVVMARSLPAAQVGRCSRSSGRARQRNSTGPCTRSNTASARSSIGGSAQCESSSITTRGRSEASTSSRRRTAHEVSAPTAAPTPRNCASRSPTDGPSGCAAIRSRQRRRDRLGVPRWTAGRLREQLDERRERDALAVGGGLPDEHRRPFPGPRPRTRRPVATSPRRAAPGW